MFLHSNTEIDPKQITLIKKVKPDGLLGSFVDFLTFGISSPKLEQETFTAISILHQIHMGLMSLKVNNIIRLSIDNYDFFFDSESKEDDLSEAISQVETKIDPIGSKYFDEIILVLEHNIEGLKIYIKISILRKHRIGEYPIQIDVYGLPSDLKLSNFSSINELKEYMHQNIFATQEQYNSFINEKESKFEEFNLSFENYLAKFIKVDGINRKTRTKIIRPLTPLNNPEEIPHLKDGKMLNRDYPGIKDQSYYSWIWSEMCFTNKIVVRNSTIVDHELSMVFSVGNRGFKSNDYTTLNPNQKFALPLAADINTFNNNYYIYEVFEGEEEKNQDSVSWLNEEIK